MKYMNPTNIKRQPLWFLCIATMALALPGCFKRYTETTGGTNRSEQLVRVSEFPTCTISSSSGSWRSDKDFTLEFECEPPVDFPTDLIERVMCQNTRDGGFVECDTRMSHEFLDNKEGTNILRVQAFTRGDRESEVKSLTLRVDTLEPTLENFGFDQIINNIPRIRMTPTDDASGSGIKRVLCQVIGPGSAGAWYKCGNAQTRYVDLQGLQKDQNYEFKAKTEDRAGNMSNELSTTFFTNFVAPAELCSISPIQSPTQLTTVVVNFTCNSAQKIASRECRLSGDAWGSCSNNTKHTLSGLSPGNHTFEVRFVNEHGQASPANSTSFVVDITPPTLNITQAQTQGLTAQFQFEAQDNVGMDRTECAAFVDGSTPVFSSCDQSYARQNLLSGKDYIFRVRAFDLAGNMTSRDYSWDTTPPVGLPICSINTSFPNGYSTSPDSTVSFSCFSPHGNVSFPQCQVNGGSWEDCSSVTSHILRNKANGEHIDFCVQTSDMWNRQSANSCISWIVSTIPPQMKPLAIDIANPYARLFFETEPSSCPVIQYECKLSGPTSSHDWQSCESPKIYSGLLLEQDYKFEARALTRCGQTSNTQIINWTSRVGYEGPSCQIVPVASAQWQSTTLQEANIVCENTPTAVKYECSENGTDWSDCSNPISVGSPLTGSKTYFARGVDDLDVRGAIAQHTFYFDLSDPVVTVNTMNWNSSEPEFFFSATDLGSGIETTECQIQGVTQWAPCSSPVSYDDQSLKTPGGSFTFRVRATDNSGRSSAIASHTWTNGGWSAYGACVRQSNGSGLKTRECNTPSPANGGYVCQGNASMSCTPPPPPTCTNGAADYPGCLTCPAGEDFAIDNTCKPIATNNGWSAWSACSASCGGGYQTRDCVQPNTLYSQSSCSPTTPGQAKLCNTQPCCLQSGTFLGTGDVPGFSRKEVSCHSSQKPGPVTENNASLGCCSNKIVYSNPSKKTAITCGPGTNCSFCSAYVPGVNQPNYNWDNWKVHCK